MTFLELYQNEWTNTDLVQEIDAHPDGTYLVILKSGDKTLFNTDWGKKVIKNFLDQ